MKPVRRARRGLIWAIAGGVILVIGIVAILIGSLQTPSTPSPSASTGAPPSPSLSTPPVSGDPDAVVDANVTERGWVAEPITTDPESYARAALAAASTFDTTRSTRDEWLTYLGSWFTVDTRYETDADQQAELDAALLELRQGVVLPEPEWDSLAAENGRIVASVDGVISLSPVPDDTTGDMSIATADVSLTYTRADASGKETSYDEMVRVSVQVLCGPGTAPTPDSSQRAGDCKVVRFFTEPMEP